MRCAALLQNTVNVRFPDTDKRPANPENAFRIKGLALKPLSDCLKMWHNRVKFFDILGR